MALKRKLNNPWLSNEINFSNDDILSRAQDIVQYFCPDGELVDFEWDALCPNRSDNHIGAFKYNINTNKWADFSFNKGGLGPITYVEYALGISYDEAKKKIEEFLSNPQKQAIYQSKKIAQQTQPAPVWTAVIPVPKEAISNIPFSLESKSDVKTTKYSYFTKEGQLAFYIIRKDFIDPITQQKQKTLWPLSYGHYENEIDHWAWKGVTNVLRPLYGIEKLKSLKPEQFILIVEGEKTCDAAQQLLGDTCQVMSWCNGAMAIKKSDWNDLLETFSYEDEKVNKDGLIKKTIHRYKKPIARIIIWPDNDEAGMKAAENIAELLGGVQVVILNSAKFPSGWDLADAQAEGWTKEKVLKFMTSIKYFVGDSFEPNDLWYAKWLSQCYGQEVRYDQTEKDYRIWNGYKWARDHTKKLNPMADEAFDKLNNKFKSKFVIKATEKLKNHGPREQVLKVFQSLPGISITADCFDQSLSHIALMNGVYDLNENKFSDSDPNFYNKKAMNCIYQKNPDPKIIKVWDDMLHQILVKEDGTPDEDLIRWFWQIIGYCLSGYTDNKCIYLCHGKKGDNAKSALLEAIGKCFGDYFKKISSDLIMDTKKQSDGNQASQFIYLKGIRFSVGTEIEQKQLSIKTIKDMVGGDTITARDLYEKPQDFRQTHKLFIYGNEKLKIPSSSEAIWTKLKLIPFNAYFPIGHPKRRDRVELEKELLNANAGFLYLAIQGWKDFQQHGFIEPDCVKKATQQYYDEENPFAGWLHKNFVNIADVTRQDVKQKEVREEWVAFCKQEEEEYDITPKAFSELLKKVGIKPYRGATNISYLEKLKRKTGVEKMIDMPSPSQT
jgi:P4 family phage/plasmid primase-like protien